MSWIPTRESPFGFGLAGVKREGQKLGPVDYLTMNGDWPPRSFYTDEEYLQVQQDGWEYVEDIS